MLFCALSLSFITNAQITKRVFYSSTNNSGQINPINVLNVCAGQTITFTDSSTAALPIIAWRWRIKNISLPDTFNTRSATVTYNNVGTDTVFLRVNNTTGVDSLFFLVRVNALPVAPTITNTGTSNLICSGSSVTLTTITTGVAYQWRLNGNPIASATAQSYNANAAGNYSLVVSNNGCNSAPSTPIAITVTAAPDASIGDPLTSFRKCGSTINAPNFQFEIQNISTTTATNNSYTINWGDGSPTTTKTSSWGLFDTAGHLYTSVGSFIITLTVTAVNGCVSNKTYNLFNGTSPALGVSTPANTVGCAPQTFAYVFNAATKSNTPSTTYTVRFDDGSPIQNYTQSNLPDSIIKTFSFTPCSLGLGVFKLYVTATNPCLPNRNVIIDAANISQKPTANFSISPNDTVCVNSNITFTNTSFGGVANPGQNLTCDSSLSPVWNILPSSSGGLNWSIVSGNPLASNQMVINFKKAGSYQVRLVVRHDVGTISPCNVDTIIKTICVNPNSLPTFTLNQDSGCGPLSINATNTSNTLSSCGPNRYRWRVVFNGSICTPATGSWSFTNGTDSTSINPRFVFNNTGSYGLSLTIMSPCDTVTSAVRNIFVISKPQANIVTVPNFCGSASISPTTNPNPPFNCYSGNPLSYAWSFPGAIPNTSNASNPTVNYNTPGTYIYTANISNNCGATVLIDTFTIHPLPLKVNVTGGGAYCAGAGGVPVGISSSVSGVQYRLILNGSVVAGPINGNGSALSFGNQLNAGTYKVLATNTGVTPNCADTMNGNAVVVVNLIPSIPSLSNTTICAGNTVTLNANATGTISWYNSLTTDTILATGTTFTTPVLNNTKKYYVMRTVAGCNSARDSITVTVNPIPELNTLRTKQICSGENTAIFVGANVTNTTYTYTAVKLNSSANINGFSSSTAPVNGDINQTLTNNDTIPNTIRYILTPTANGCVGARDTVDVLVKPKPTLIVSATDSICSGGVASIALTPNISVSTVSWNTTLLNGFASGFSNLTNTTNRLITQTITNDSNVLASVRYGIVANLNGCKSDSQFVVVNIKPVPNIWAIGDSVCSGLQTNITLNSNVLNTRFTWTTNAVAGVTGNRDSLLNNNGPIQQRLVNTTNVALTVNYTINPIANGCVAPPKQIGVVVKPVTKANATNANTCSGIINPIPLSSVLPGALYTWNASLFLGSATGFTPQATPVVGPIAQSVINSSNGPATVRYTIQAVLNGCTGPDTNVFLTINPVPLVSAVGGNVCSGDTNLITINSTLGNTFYTWTVAGGVIGSSPQNTPIAGPIKQRLFNNGTDTIRATYFITPNYNGCAGLPIVASTLVYPRPTMNAVSGEVCDGETTAIKLTSNNSNTQYRWTVNNIPGIGGATNRGLGNDTIAQTLTNSTVTNQVVTYTVTPEFNGCAGNSVLVNVTVKPRPLVTVTPQNLTICSGGIAVINLSSNTSGASYTWTSTANPINSVIGNSNKNNVLGPIRDTLISNNINQATVAYQIVANVNGCSSLTPANASVAINPLPTINAGVDINLCNQNSLTQLAGFTPVGGSWSGVGITNASGIFNPIIAGNGSHNLVYTFTNNITGCINRDTLLATVAPPTPVNAGSDVFKCLNDAPFNLLGLPLGGSWYGSPRVNSAGLYTPSTARTDTIVYTAGSGSCQTYDTVLVVVRPLPAALVGNAQTICPGQNITLGTAASPGSFYSWQSNPFGDSSNFANPTFSPSTSTRYILREENSFGCSKTDSVLITVLPPISNNTISGNQFLCGGTISSALIGQTATGGNGNISYQWQDSTSGGVFVNISGETNASYAPGFVNQTTSYRRIVTSGLCVGNNSSVSNVVRIVIVPNISNNTIGLSQEVCAGTSINGLNSTSTITGGTGTYRHQWQQSNDSLNWINTSLADTLVTYTPSGITTTTYYRRVVFSATCSNNSLPVKITIIPAIDNNTIGSDQTICGGQLSPQLNGSTPTGGKNNNYIYLWQQSTNGTIWVDIIGANTKNYTPGIITNTTYFRRIVSSTPCAGTTASISNVVLITILPAITGNTIAANQQVCNGQIPASITATTSANGGNGTYNYQWQISSNGTSWSTTSITTNSFLFNSPVNQTTYLRRILNSLTCADTSNTINISLLPNISNNTINPITAICNGTNTDSITGPDANAGTFGISYQWQDSNAVRGWQNIIGATSRNLAPQNPIQNTYYRRIVRTLSTPICENISAAALLTVHPKPSAALTINSPCKGQSALLTSTSTGLINSYTWHYGDGTASFTSNQNNSTHIYNAAGNYLVALVVNTLAGCKDSVSQQITIYPKPNVSYTASNVCAGNSTTFTSSSTIAASSSIDSLRWIFGDGTELNGNSTSTNKLYNTWGNYNTKLIVTSVNGCKDSAQRIIRVNPLPVVDFTSNTVCFGQSTLITNNSSIPSGNIQSYLWIFTDNNTTSAATAPSRIFTNSGLTNVSLSAVSDSGCSNSTIKQVLVHPVINPLSNTLTTNPSILCSGSIPSIINGGTPIGGVAGSYTYIWQSSNNGTTWNNISGANSESLSINNVLTQTTYYRRIVNSGSCSHTSDSIRILIVPAIQNNAIAGTMMICANTKADTLRGATPTGAAIPTFLSYRWQDSIWGRAWQNLPDSIALGKDLSPLTLNTTTHFRRIVTSGLCNSVSNVVTIIVNPKPLASFNTSNICAQSTASFTSTSSISSGTITNHEWFYCDGTFSCITSNTSVLKTYNVAGNFNVSLKVVSNFGCSDSFGSTISVYPKPIASFSVNNVCLGNQSVFNSNSTIGLGSIINEFKWSFGDSTLPLIATPPVTKQYTNHGSYQTKLVVTSNNGCIDSASRLTLIFAKPVAQFTFDTACFGQSTQFVNQSIIASGGISNYTWSFGDASTSTQTNLQKLYNTPGLFTVQLKAVSDNLCEDVISKQVTVNDIISGNEINPSQRICQGTIPSVISGGIVSGGNGSYTYQWQSSTDKVNWANVSSNQQLTFIAPLSFNTYFRRIVTSGKCTSISSIDSVIIVPAITNNEISGNATLCTFEKPDTIRGTIPVGANIPTSLTFRWQISTDSLTWNDIALSNTRNFVPGHLTNSVFYRRIVDSDICNNTSNVVKVLVNPKPLASFTASNACLNYASTFQSNSTVSNGSIVLYDWNFGDGTATGFIGSNNTSRIYNASRTDTVRLIIQTNLGCKDTAYRLVTTYPKPTASYTVNNSCFGVANNFNAQSSIGNINTFKWNFGDGIELTNNQPTTSKTYNTSGTYNTKLIVTSNNGCIDSIGRSLVINPRPQANFTADTVCFNQTSTLTNLSNISSGVIAENKWLFADNNSTANTQHVSRVFTQAGITNVKLVVKSDSACADSIVLPVLVRNVIDGNTISAPVVKLCSGSTAGLISGSTPIGGNNIFSYQWQQSNNGLSWIIILGATGRDLNLTQPLTNTTYLRRVVTSGTCSHISDSIRIMVVPPITSNSISGNATLCAVNIPDSLLGTLPAGGNIPIQIIYQWQDSSAGSVWTNISGANGINYQPPFLNKTTHFRRLVTSDVCLSISNTINIIVNPKPTAQFSGNNVCLGFQANFNSSSSVTVGSITNYNWNYGNGFSNNATNTTSYTYDTAGTYQVRLIVTTNNGCKDTITKPVIVYPKPVASYTNTNACFGFANQFQSNSSIVIGSSILNHKWSFGDGTELLSTNYQTNKTYNAAGTYLSKLVVTTNDGCKDSTIRSLVVNPKPTADFTNTTVCLNQTTQLNTTSNISSGSISNYFWNFDDNSTSNLNNPSKTYLFPGTYNVMHVVVSDSSCRDTVVKPVLVWPLISGNTISASQVICQGNIPTSLQGSATLVGGNSSFTYVWQSSSDSLSWQNVPGGNQATLNFGAPGLTNTTFFRRLVNSGTCTDISVPIKISVLPILTNNFIVNAQTICFGQVPNKLIGNRANGGNGTYTYQWQSSPDSISWTNITATNDTSYQSPALTSTLYFRRMVTSGPCISLSNHIKINVLPSVNGNQIGNNQTVCIGQSAAPLNGVQLLSGGDNVFQYQWQTSTDSLTWTNIFGATNANYVPGVLIGTIHYFRRVVTSGPCNTAQSSTSNVVGIRILPLIANNTITSSQTICNAQQPATINGSLPTGGDNTYTYIWQSCTDSLSWNNIIGQTSQNLQPGVLFQTTWYKRIVNSNACGNLSTPIKITVLPSIANNDINGNQIICFGSQPNTIIGIKPTGGQEGIYTYTWQDSSATSGWNNIAGATDTSYTPTVLFANRHYRRLVNSGPCIGPQTSISSIVTIVVNPLISNNIISQNQTICEFGTPSIINGITPSGGNGIYTYQWQISPDSVNWTNINVNGTSVNYQPTPLTATQYLRRRVNSGPCSNISNVLKIIVQPQLNNNVISSNQIICSAQLADTLRGSQPIGGNGINYTYQWLQSNDSINWNNIPNTQSAFFYPGSIASTTFYKRTVFSGECSLKSNVIKVFTEPLPIVNFTFNNSCYPDSIRFNQQVTISRGNIASYLWQFGDGSLAQGAQVSKLYSLPANYNVRLKVISGFGCTDSISKTAVLFPKPIANFGASFVCYPSSTQFTDSTSILTGTITKWNWDFGDGTTSILKNPIKQYNTPGSYLVTLIVESNNGCKDTIVKEIKVYPKPVANFIANTPCFPSPVNFIDSSRILTGNIVHRLWSFGNGDTSTILNPTIHYATAGSYLTRLIVNSDNGCSDTALKTVNVNALPQVSFRYDTLSCVGSTVALNNTTTGAVNYLWNFGNSQTSTQVNPSLLYSDTGYYQIKLIAFTSNGCKDSLTKTIEITKIPIANFSLLPDSGCGPLLVRFTNTSKTRYSTFRWNDGMGHVIDSINISDRVYKQSRIQDSLYRISLVVTNLCGISTKSDTIKVFPKPISNFIMSIDSGCTPLTVTFLNRTTGFPRFYKWNMGNAANYITPNPPSQTYLAFNNDTTYFIKLITSNECGFDTIIKSVIVRKNNVKSFFTADKSSGCAPLTVQFFNQSENNLFVSWSFDDGNGSTALNPIHTFTQSGIYRVKQFVSNGCGFDTSVYNITVLPAPSVSFRIQSDTLCRGKQIKFLNTTLNAGALTWYFGNGDSSIITNPTYSYNNPGRYAVTLKAVSNTSGCSNTYTDTIEIYQNPIADFNLSDADICLKETVTLNNSSQFGDYYLWRYGDGRISSLSAPNVQYNTPGLFKVTLIASTLNGCVDSASKNVRVFPIPDIKFDYTPKQACDKPTLVNFTNQSSGVTDYTWYFHDGTLSTTNNPSYTYSGVGNYPIKLVAQNQFGCKDSITSLFNIYPQPKANFTSPNIAGCVPLTVAFQNNSTGGLLSNRWYFGTIDSSELQNPAIIINDSGQYDVKLVVIGEGGCADSITKPNYITAHPKPFAMFDYVIKYNPAIDGTATFFNKSKGMDLSSKWRFNIGAVSTETNPTYQFPFAGNFKVELEVTTKYNCSDVTDTIIDFPFFGGIYVPNAFSPDDGSNDLVRQFLPAGTGLGEYRLEIYNTWGELVWFTEELRDTKPAQGWLGYNLNNIQMPQGVYVWKIEAKYINGMPWEGMPTKLGTKTNIGDLILIR